jgi:hypothetical protein
VLDNTIANAIAIHAASGNTRRRQFLSRRHRTTPIHNTPAANPIHAPRDSVIINPTPQNAIRQPRINRSPEDRHDPSQANINNSAIIKNPPR